MDVEEALQQVELWHCIPCKHYTPACALAPELRRVRQVIREYAADTGSGERFAALIALVPGLSLAST